MDKEFLDKLADAFETVAEYEGVVVLPKEDIKAGSYIELDNENECEMGVGGNCIDKHLALFTFCKMARNGIISVECSDVENKDWKYFVKLLNENDSDECDE